MPELSPEEKKIKEYRTKKNVLLLLAVVVVFFVSKWIVNDLKRGHGNTLKFEQNVNRSPSTPKSAYNFELAGKMQESLIRDAIKRNGELLGSAYCLKAPGFSGVYFVAAKVKENMSGYTDVAVWSIGGQKEQPGMTFSVNKYAKELSGFPLGKDTKVGVSMADDGAMELKQYVDGR